MGPRLFRRGNPEPIKNHILESLASMGPRLFRRGNYQIDLEKSLQRLLQWGHAFSDVEIGKGSIRLKSTR